MARKILWVNFSQRVHYCVGIPIGNGNLGKEKADRLVEKLNGKTFPSDCGDDADVIECVYNHANKSYACEWEDFEDLNVYIEEK